MRSVHCALCPLPTVGPSVGGEGATYTVTGESNCPHIVFGADSTYTNDSRIGLDCLDFRALNCICD